MRSDVVLFSLLGLLGLLILFLWAGTIRTWTKENFNLLWALPTHLPAALLLLGRKNSHILGPYFWGTAVLLALVLVTWPLIPQELPPVLLPFLGIIMIRAYRVSKILAPRKLQLPGGWA